MASTKLLILCMVVMLAVSQTHAYFRAGRDYIPGDLNNEQQLNDAAKEYLKTKRETAKKVR